MPRVFNKRNGDIPKDAVYVGRPSKWGNPYEIGKNGWGREDVVRLYRESLGELDKHEIRKELAGKDLVCWCFPKSCHADVLLEIANS